jgi:hypothetical protein
VLLGPHRSESKSAAPRYSPGLVKSNEVVLRTILDPDHLLESGHLRSAAITLDDIRFRGWSVDRRKFTSTKRLKLFHQDWKKRQPKIERFYVLPVQASVIRFNAVSQHQEFVVTDAAECNKPCHAAVFLASTEKHSQSQLRQFRNELIERLPKYIDVDDVFEKGEESGYFWGMARQCLAFLLNLFRLRGWRYLFFSRR